MVFFTLVLDRRLDDARLGVKVTRIRSSVAQHVRGWLASDVAELAADFRCWHSTYIPTAPANVRYSGMSGLIAGATLWSVDGSARTFGRSLTTATYMHSGIEVLEESRSKILKYL